MIRGVRGHPRANNRRHTFTRREFSRSVAVALLAAAALAGCEDLPNIPNSRGKVKPGATKQCNASDPDCYGEAQIVAGSMVAESQYLKLDNGSFKDGDVGKLVVVVGAGETRRLSDAAIAANSVELTSASGRFRPSDVRSVVTISGAGSGGSDLTTSVKAFVNDTTITLTDAAATEVSRAAATVTAYLTTNVVSVSGNEARLNDEAGRTVTGATVLYGTDNTKALAQAIAAGGEVVIPAGKYLTAASVSLDTASNVIVRGAGRTATVIYQVGTGGAAIFQTRKFTHATPLTKFSMTDLTLDGAFTQGQYHVDNCGVRIEYLAQCTFRDMTIRNTLATGLGIDSLFNGSLVENVVATNCGASAPGVGPGCAGIGIGLSGDDNDFIVRNCWTEGNGTFGIFVETANKATVIGPQIVGCTAVGNELSGFADAAGKGATWTACYSYGNKIDGFTNCSGTVQNAVPGRDTHWEDCVAIGNGRHGFSYEPWRLGLPSAPYQPNPNLTSNVTWKNCRASGNGQNGFEMNAATATINGITVDGCMSYENMGSGLAFVGQGGTVMNVAVTGGLFNSNNEFGVVFAPGLSVENAAVRDTTFRANQAGTISVPTGVTVDLADDK